MLWLVRLRARTQHIARDPLHGAVLRRLWPGQRALSLFGAAWAATSCFGSCWPTGPDPNPRSANGTSTAPTPKERTRDHRLAIPIETWWPGILVAVNQERSQCQDRRL